MGGAVDGNPRLDAALAYHRHGWAVIPAAERGKRPIVRWQIYQDGMPGEKAVRDWFARWPNANLSVVTGTISGIVVLDVDPDVITELMLAWNRTRCRPPLDDEEVIRTVRSIEKTQTRAH